MKLMGLVLILGVSLQAAAAPRAFSGLDVKTSKPKTVSAGEKGAVLVFLSARCPCSDSHIAILKELAAEFTGFAFVAVHANLDEPAAETRAYFEGRELPFPVLEDEGQKLANEFRALKTPHVFVMSPEGRVLYKGGVTDSSHAPAADRNYLREALADASLGRPVRVAEGRTLGCEIKRSKKHVW